MAVAVDAALGAWLLSLGPLLAVVRPLVASGPAALPGLGLATLLGAVCAVALLGCTAWLLVTTSLAVLDLVGGRLAPGRVSALRALAERGCPTLLRAVVAALLGLGLGAVVAGPALADPPGVPTGHRGPAALTGLALPDRVPGAPRPRDVAPRAGPAPATVVVRAGDSLWSIAAGLLPREADATDITAAWHRLHRTNLARVGQDPDLILPGTRLVVPGPLAPHGEERQ
jgi:hypothetical protein